MVNSADSPGTAFAAVLRRACSVASLEDARTGSMTTIEAMRVVDKRMMNDEVKKKRDGMK